MSHKQPSSRRRNHVMNKFFRKSPARGPRKGKERLCGALRRVPQPGSGAIGRRGRRPGRDRPMVERRDAPSTRPKSQTRSGAVESGGAIRAFFIFPIFRSDCAAPPGYAAPGDCAAKLRALPRGGGGWRREEGVRRHSPLTMDNIDRKRLIPYRTWERISECKKEKFPVQRRARAWADPFGLSTPLPMPASADALMQTLDTMPYAQRNGSVARLGRDHAAHPQMGALIVALRQAPPRFLLLFSLLFQLLFFGAFPPTVLLFFFSPLLLSPPLTPFLAP